MPKEMREEVSRRVVLSGGLSSIPGLIDSFKNRYRQIMEQERSFKVKHIGRIFTHLEAMKKISLDDDFPSISACSGSFSSCLRNVFSES